MISIATVYPNNLLFDRTKYYCNLPLLANDISGFIRITTIDPTELMEAVITEMGLTPESIGASPICQETENNIYQVCHTQEKDENLTQTKAIPNPNQMAGYLINDTIGNKCVLINSKISPDKTCIPDSITLDDISKILYSKFFHTGVCIKTDGTTTEFIYGDHPLEYYKLQTYDEEKYKIKEFEFVSLGLCAIIDTTSTDINKIMTRIIGTEVILGDALLISKIPEAYHDLNLTLFAKINQLSYGPTSHRILTEDEKKDPEKINDLHVVNNKYCILNARAETTHHDIQCGYCTKPTTTNTCKSCYRVKYCSKDCQVSDWHKHKDDCLYKK